jgi:hypothetical protein
VAGVEAIIVGAGLTLRNVVIAGEAKQFNATGAVSGLLHS